MNGSGVGTTASVSGSSPTGTDDEPSKNRVLDPTDPRLYAPDDLDAADFVFESMRRTTSTGDSTFIQISRQKKKLVPRHSYDSNADSASAQQVNHPVIAVSVWER